MSDGDRDALMLAAAAAAVLAAAVLLCRPRFIRPALLRTSFHLTAEALPSPPPDTPCTDTDKSKSPRTKERRRRGKDPLRDILKSGKKLKPLSKANLAPDRQTATKAAPASDSPSPQSGVDVSAPSSSRSVSSSRSRAHTPLQDAQLSDGGDQAESAVSTVSDTDQLASRQSEPAAHPSTSLSSESAPSSDSSPTPITTPANLSSDLGPPPASKSPEILSATIPVHPLLRKPSVPDADTPTATSSVNGFHGTRHIPTPRRTPTPSSDTNTLPPSVAIQTQLASVRGALEAARQREAQMKAELEKYAKEVEFMRWESAGWRRRELELQNQVHYLAHQLQTVAASFSPMRASSAPLASSPKPPLNGAASPNSSTSSSSANASPTKKEYNVPLPSLNPPQPHIIPPSGLFSPMSMMHSPMYYGYPSTGGNHYSHFSPQNHPHPHSFPLSPTQPTSLMSMFSPNGSAAPSSGGGNSGPSSAPDSSSSAGSLSPGSRVDRGRRMVRGNMHLGGWIGLSTEEEGAYNESSDEEENEVNKALADAILKRPGSLQLGKSRSRKLRSSPNGEPATDEKSSPSSESQAEFTFPSLSALGNVKWGKQRSADRDSESVARAPAKVNGVIADLEGLEEKGELLETEAQAGAVADPQPGASDLPAG